MVFCRFAVADQAVGRVGEQEARKKRKDGYLALASLTLMRGRARSSRRRWLCSVRRRSLSSDMDCLWGRAFIVCERRGENDEDDEEEVGRRRTSPNATSPSTMGILSSEFELPPVSSPPPCPTTATGTSTPPGSPSSTSSPVSSSSAHH